MDLRLLERQTDPVVIVGFFDLAGFANWCVGRPPQEILSLATNLFTRISDALEQANGTLVKAIGDAGLFVFPADAPDETVTALLEIKEQTDRWLEECGYPEKMAIKLTVGPVACGMVGASGDQRLDIYGETVNNAAMMRGEGFHMSDALKDILSDDTKRMIG